MIYASCNENAQCVHMDQIEIETETQIEDKDEKEKSENYMNVYLMDTYLDVCVF